MTDERLLEEYSRMNNELINARRELERANRELTANDRLLANVLGLIPQVAYVYDFERGGFEYANRRIEGILGYGPQEAGGTTVEDSLRPLMPPEDFALYLSHLEALRGAGDGEILEIEFRVRAKDGSLRWMWARDAVFDRDGSGRAARAIGIAEEITAMKLREERLSEASLLDRLTGVRNRRGFEELAGQQLLVAARKGRPCAVAYVDLDGLKSINDRFGHAEGDEALRSAAGILKGALRAGDVLARLGGDEFAVLLADAGGEVAEEVLARFELSARDRNEVSAKPWRVGFSAGFAIFDPAAPEGLEALLDRADGEMYRRKRSRREED